MSEFDDLLQKLLDQKPELTRSDIEEQIKQKKEKIGAGYLTDQGALFLIASDYGVTLSEPLKVEKFVPVPDPYLKSLASLVIKSKIPPSFTKSSFNDCMKQLWTVTPLAENFPLSV